ncbi:MAG: carboxypeptidase-like regulatory domain-containing protein [Planctomycetales bacterium]
MKNHWKLFVGFVALVGMGWIQIPALEAADYVHAQPASAGDIALDQFGQIHGRLTAQNGKPIAGATMVLQAQGSEIAQTVTNSSGEFVFRGVKGGLYQLTGVGPSGSFALATYRVWSSGLAPPTTRQIAELVVKSPGVRGQTGNSMIPPFMTRNTWMSAAILSAVIATPIIIANEGS